MHVVVASHHRLPVEGYGGPQRVVVALVQALAALGHRVTVLAQPGTKLAAASRIVEIPARALKNGTSDLTPFLPDNADIVHAHFPRSEEHTSELQSRLHLVCRLLLEKKNSHASDIRA